ncbi:hypothetical protein KZ483_12225 [Paenibacillus sp. sptzw28]|uniref:hypothetical protein n=1 Tax=Paenibacillus sp. sptzw28 TaxID=715179 RepID=UPI001C6F270C|nr:hypothetical protein [Paenibacillus sp. sptzw28]QYR23591.1 hypothetical protein KZ483_12225 [Paenibacillus sp. sptzw28]
MRIGTARAVAAEWVTHNASREVWFRGAYFSGSTVGMSDEAKLSPASDVDIVIVTAQTEPPLKLGKFIFRDTLLEVTYLSWNELSSVEEVLSSYHLAGSFRVDTIIADPTGHLRLLQTQVAHHFAVRRWVRRRCENATQRVENSLRAIDISAPWHDQVTAWLFPTGITAHVLLVAALRNPTVRLRYLAARGVLDDYGHSGLYNDLLKLLGCVDLTASRVEQHLTNLEHTFDAAAAAAKTPFFFSTDITAVSRSVAIDGSRELIRAGNHHEAIFWIVATFARCHKILAADAPHLLNVHAPAFHEIVADLGITSAGTLIHRARDVIQFLPRLWKTSEAILSANPGIVDK